MKLNKKGNGLIIFICVWLILSALVHSYIQSDLEEEIKEKDILIENLNKTNQELISEIDNISFRLEDCKEASSNYRNEIRVINETCNFKIKSELLTLENYYLQKEK